MSLENVLQHAGNWHGDNVLPAGGDRLSSGFPQLDTLLSGGWPRGALTEILVSHEGIGALNLLMPALARLARRRRWLAWVAPPYVPHALTLVQAGVDLSRVLMVHPRRAADNVWATEQALRSGTCGAVLTWLAGGQCQQTLNRLQLAAESGNTWGVLFRPVEAAREPSRSAVRLRLAPHPRGIQVHVLKHQGTCINGINRIILDVNRVVVKPPSAPMVAGSADSRRLREFPSSAKQRAQQASHYS